MTDVRNYSVIYATKHGLEKTKEKCFRFWERRESCINCIARKAYEKKGQVVKLKFVDRNVYGIIAEYIEINRQPYVLEIVCHTEENILLSSYGKSQFIDKISNYNKQYYQDVLTKTYDRRYYEEYVRNMNNIITLAIIDANGFKEINDHFGHAAGDEALKKLSKAIKDCIRKDDYLIRYGGDEFLVILPAYQKDGAVSIARDIKDAFDHVILHAGAYHDIVRLSIGVAGIRDEETIQDLLNKCDQRKYISKRDGKHRITY